MSKTANGPEQLPARPAGRLPVGGRALISATRRSRSRRPCASTSSAAPAAGCWSPRRPGRWWTWRPRGRARSSPSARGSRWPAATGSSASWPGAGWARCTRPWTRCCRSAWRSRPSSPTIARRRARHQRLRAEVRLARKVTHPNVCRIFELGCPRAGGLDGRALPFLTMELLNGETLASAWPAGSRSTSTRGCALAQQMVAALAAIHAAGIVHRDFKSDNASGALPGRARAAGADGLRAGRAAVGSDGRVAERGTAHRRDRGLHGARAAAGRTGRRRRPTSMPSGWCCSRC